MDPRFAMADTYRLLDSAGIALDGFNTEVNNCQGPEDALRICAKWQAIANGLQLLPSEISA
jgi:hypothetical protein